MSYETIVVKPIAGALGAQVEGADLRRPLDNRTWSEIHRAFLEHQVIYFRDQNLDPDQLTAFGRRFGEPNVYPFVKGIEGYPHLFEIRKEPEQARNFGGNWHSDSTYLEKPPLGTMLYCKEVPAYGGDTLIANQYLSYEALSDGMKKLLDGVTGIYSAGLKRYGGRSDGHGAMKQQNLANAPAIEAEHPVVRTHPETRRKALYVNNTHLVRFKDMTEAESEPLIDWLQNHAVKPEFTCRIRWESGTVGIWDNRCVQHFAVNDYTGHRRVMYRMTVGPELPV